MKWQKVFSNKFANNFYCKIKLKIDFETWKTNSGKNQLIGSKTDRSIFQNRMLELHFLFRPNRSLQRNQSIKFYTECSYAKTNQSGLRTNRLIFTQNARITKPIDRVSKPIDCFSNWMFEISKPIDQIQKPIDSLFIQKLKSVFP